jgi:Tol biopolymer transport system component
MALAPGTRIGAYEVEAALGGGAMGDVYRARDTRLARRVALKVLPGVFASDPERLARFEREARALAALNHPHIATLYDVAQGDDGLTALVMELVDGETLASRIRRRVNVDEALALARQIASALDAAHMHGVIHRDLKPANVMVTDTGHVKVLDFGLAKLRPEARVDDAAAEETTLTESGLLLGTPVYMSPEQVRGQAVDKRADIWAFGCLLYELLTARRAFAGASVSDVLAAVLQLEPDWTVLPATTPVRVREVLRRCLTKDLTGRARDIGDVLLDLDTSQAGDATAAGASTLPVRRRSWWWAAAAATATAIAGSAFVIWTRPAASSSAGGGPIVGALVRLTSDIGLTTDPSLSADGRLVAYASNRRGSNLDVFVQQASGGPAIRLTDDPADDHQTSVSPDGRSVAFRSERSPRGIYVVPALGGNARLLAPDGRGPRFSPDGQTLAFWTSSRTIADRGIGAARQAFVMPAGGGVPTRVATNLSSAGDLVWSPDGKSLLLFGWEIEAGPEAGQDWWWVRADETMAVRTNVLADLRARGFETNLLFPVSWTAAGVLVDQDDRSGDAAGLKLVPVDQTTGRLMGPVVHLTNGTTRDARPAASATGTVIFSAQDEVRTVFQLPLDANEGRARGPLRRLSDDRVTGGRTSLSRDGLSMVLPKYESGQGSLWIRELRTGKERQLLVTPLTPLNPVMSPNGRWVAYTITKVLTGGDSGVGDVMVIPAAGGVPRKVCEACIAQAWTEDEMSVVVGDGTDSIQLDRIHVGTGARRPLLRSSKGRVDRPMFAPNGRWMSFNAPGAVFVAPVYEDRTIPDAEWRKVLDISDGDRTAGLSPDGRLLYVLLQTDGFRCMYAIPMDPSTGARKGEPFPVWHQHDASRRWGSTGMGSAVGTGLFLVDLLETSGNLWMTTLPPALY